MCYLFFFILLQNQSRLTVHEIVGLSYRYDYGLSHSSHRQGHLVKTALVFGKFHLKCKDAPKPGSEVVCLRLLTVVMLGFMLIFTFK